MFEFLAIHLVFPVGGAGAAQNRTFGEVGQSLGGQAQAREPRFSGMI